MGSAGIAREKSILLSAFAERLPDRVQSSLLRACLSQGEDAGRYWREWCEDVGDPVEAIHLDRFRLKGLIPLVDFSVRNRAFETGPNLRAHLRVAHLREQSRNKIYYDVYRDILNTMRAHGVKALTMKACAVANTAHPDPTARHNHAIDLLVTRPGLPAACGALEDKGLCASTCEEDRHHRVFVHESGLAIGLHTRLFRNPYFRLDRGGIWLRSVPVQIADIQVMQVMVPSPVDQLLHTCGHASYAGGSRNFRWICDAAFLVQNSGVLDYELLLKKAARGHLTIPLLACLGYLADDLGVPVPREVVDRLRKQVSASGHAAEEAAFFSVTAFSKASTRRVVSKLFESWPTRIKLMKYVVFPSSVYMRWKYPVTSPWMLPALYLYRLLNMPRRAFQIFSHPVWRQKADARI